MNLLASSGRTIECGAGKAAALKAAIGLFIIGAPLTAMAATNVVVGANLTLVASADGTPAPTFQWRKNGANIPGATSASYPIVAATLASAGTYQVVATNSGGFAISADEVLTVTTSETAV